MEQPLKLKELSQVQNDLYERRKVKNDDTPEVLYERRKNDDDDEVKRKEEKEDEVTVAYETLEHELTVAYDTVENELVDAVSKCMRLKATIIRSCQMLKTMKEKKQELKIQYALYEKRRKEEARKRLKLKAAVIKREAELEDVIYEWRFGRHNSVEIASDMTLSQFDLLQTPCFNNTSNIRGGTMTVLTMTFIGLDNRNDLPRVSYSTALDIYVASCFMFVLATIIQFAAVHYYTKFGCGEQQHMTRYITKKLELPEIVEDQFVEEYVDDRGCKQNGNKRSTVSQKNRQDESVLFKFWNCFFGTKNVRDDRVSGTGIGLNSVSKIDKLSRIIFPLVFSAFNVLYWIVYLSDSSQLL
ncbi:Gamma-aminobutyric acid receptor subunit alpha-4 [Mactra antiquata]